MTNEKIATATSNVINGKSVSKRVLALKPYGIYEGYLDNANNGFVLGDDDYNFMVDSSFSLEENIGMGDGEHYFFIVVPDDDVEQFEYDVNWEGGVFDSEAYGFTIDGIVEEHLKFALDGNTIYPSFSNYYSINDLDYDTRDVIMNNHTYHFTPYDTVSIINGSFTYQTNHSRSDFIPGHSYTITGTYLQNNNYKEDSDTATLQMLKCPTTLSLDSITTAIINQNVTFYLELTVSNANTNSSTGTVVLYDGTEIKGTSQATITKRSGSSLSVNVGNIVASFNTAGIHDIYAVFTDNGNEYNSSTSRHIQLTINKINTTINGPSNISLYFNEGTTISGTLTDTSSNIQNATIKLKDYDGAVISTTTTNSNGEYSFTYNPTNWNVNGNNITIEYDGNATYNSSSKIISVTLQRHDSIMTVPDTTGYAEDSVTIPVSLEDENGDPVTSGSVNVDLVPIKEITLDGVIGFGQLWRFNMNIDNLTSDDFTAINNNYASAVDKTEGDYYGETNFMTNVYAESGYFMIPKSKRMSWMYVDDIPSQIYELELENIVYRFTLTWVDNYIDCPASKPTSATIDKITLNANNTLRNLKFTDIGRGVIDREEGSGTVLLFVDDVEIACGTAAYLHVSISMIPTTAPLIQTGSVIEVRFSGDETDGTYTICPFAITTTYDGSTWSEPEITYPQLYQGRSIVGGLTDD